MTAVPHLETTPARSDLRPVMATLRRHPRVRMVGARIADVSGPQHELVFHAEAVVELVDGTRHSTAAESRRAEWAKDDARRALVALVRATDPEIRAELDRRAARPSRRAARRQRQRAAAVST